MIPVFFDIGNCVSYITKTLREDRTAAEKKMLLKQPAAGGESRRRDSLFLEKRLRRRKEKCIILLSGNKNTGNQTGVKEYDIVLQVGKNLEKELLDRGYEVLLTRKDNDTLIGECDGDIMARDFQADITILLYCRKLGRYVLQGYSEETGIPDRRSDAGSYHECGMIRREYGGMIKENAAI